MKQISFFLLCFISWSSLYSQSLIPIGFDIPGAVGVEIGPKDKAWIVAGGSGANDGQVLRYNDHGYADVIVSDLPSYFNPELQELNSALNVHFVDFNLFYVIIGEVPGSTNSGTLALFDIRDYNASNKPLKLDDAISKIGVSEWVLSQGYPESNPYSMLIADSGDLVVADAAANAIIKYSKDGAFSVMADIPPNLNPLPFGPPFIDAVPTKIMSNPEGGYLVSTLTGFPFVEGGANIYAISESGDITTHATGFTLMTDMAYDPYDGELVALEFGRFGQMGFEFGSARLVKLFDDGSRETMAEGFGPSAGLGIDRRGDIYASHLFLGQLLRLERFSDCHAPLNVHARKVNNYTYTVAWNSVDDAEGYDVHVSIGEEGFAQCQIHTKRNRTTISSPYNQEIIVKVRARCGKGASDYSKELTLSFNNKSKSSLSPSVIVHGQEFVFEKQEIQVFPNPSNDFVRVQFSESQEVDRVEIYGIDGMKRLSKPVSIKGNSLELDVSSLAEGVYMLRTSRKGDVIGLKELVVVR